MNPVRSHLLRSSRQLVVIGVLGLLLLALNVLPSPNYWTRKRWPRKYSYYKHDVWVEYPQTLPSGILLFIHGCGHAGSDLWPPSPLCRHCLGLPEEVRIRHIALLRQLAVVSISSLEATASGKGCWNVKAGAPGDDDLTSVAAILQKMQSREPRLAGKPVYVLGVSSGGALALLLPKFLSSIQGVVAQIMGLPVEMLGEPADYKRGYPPTVFMQMPRDKVVAAQIEHDKQLLESWNVPVAVIKMHPRPVTAEFLHFHAPNAYGGSTRSFPRTGAIVGKLQDGEFLDAHGFLKIDPRVNLVEWTAAVRPVVGKKVSLTADQSPLTELLNLAYARHEIMSDGVDGALKWLENGGNLSLDDIGMTK